MRKRGLLRCIKVHARLQSGCDILLLHWLAEKLGGVKLWGPADSTSS